VSTIFCSGLLPRRPQCPRPRQVFSYLIDPSPGQASDKRLIFLRANDLHIPDLYLPPRLPNLLPISLLLSFLCCYVAFYVYLSRNCEVTGNARAGRFRHRTVHLPSRLPSSCTPRPYPYLFRKRTPKRGIGLRPYGRSPLVDHLPRGNGVSSRVLSRTRREEVQLFLPLLISSRNSAENIKREIWKACCPKHSFLSLK